MIRPERAVGAGPRAPSPIPRPSRVLTVVLAAVLAMAGLALAPVSPAAAEIVSGPVVIPTRCTATPPIIAPVVFDAPLGFDVTYATEIPRGTSHELRIQLGDVEVPTDLDGNTVNHVANVSNVFTAPAGFQIINAELVGGNVAANIAVGGGQITILVPGPLPGGTVVTPPEIVLELRAIGEPGHVGTISWVSSTITANATAPIIGQVNVPTSCVPHPGEAQWDESELGPWPGPAGPIASFTILPGALLPEPEVVQSDVTVGASVTYSGAWSGSSSISVPFSTIGRADLAQGETATYRIAPGPFDWHGAASAVAPSPLVGTQWEVRAVRNVSFAVQIPAGFALVEASSDASIDFTPGPGVRTITYLDAPAGSGLRVLPPVDLEIQAIDPHPATGTLRVTGHGFQFERRSRTCVVLCGGWGSYSWGTASVSLTGGGTDLFTIGVVDFPVANDDSATVGNDSSVTIDLLANDEAGSFPLSPSSVLVVDEPIFGTLEVDPDTGAATYTPTLGTAERSDSFSYVVSDIGGRPSNLATVSISIVSLYCVAGEPGVPADGCSLDQFLEFEVVGDPLSISQEDANVTLDTITLDGEAQTTSGNLNTLTISNRRGDGQAWSVTGQVTDFKALGYEADCPASDPSTWSWQCIPGDNLGWQPLASVGHHAVPGDVATVSAGSAITSGLGSSAQSLCLTVPTTAGGTFTCGAVLTLLTPASAAARVYQATLTLTLA